MLDYNFKNNFNDKKINIFIPIDEIYLREKNRANFYQYNHDKTWNCQVAQLMSNSFDKPKKPPRKPSKLRIKRQDYVGKVLGIKI